MAATTPTTEARATRASSVRVWDWGVRLFHWSLVAGIAFEFLFEPGTVAHNTLGQAIPGLVALRLVWGFVGSRHARFADFVRGPLATARYVRDILRGHPRRYIGHNPAGAAMVVALLAMVSLTAGTGWAMITDALWGEDWIEELHETAAWATLALIVAHVAGVVVASIQHRENLVGAMITGNKEPD